MMLILIIHQALNFIERKHILTICERTEKMAFVVALPDSLTDCLKFTFPSLPIKPNSNGRDLKMSKSILP